MTWRLSPRFFIFVWFPLLLCTCKSPSHETQVAAAISLKPLLEHLKPDLEHTLNRPVRFVFASSGVLKTQILQGAPYDVFISASPQEADAVQKDRKALSLIFLKNRLALATSKERTCPDLTSWLKSRPTVALGNPQTVPAGRYARSVLEHYQRWAPWQSQFRLTENARQTVAYLKDKRVDFGLVYQSDVRHFEADIQSCHIFESDTHPPINIIWTQLTLPMNTAWDDWAKTRKSQIEAYGFHLP